MIWRRRSSLSHSAWRANGAFERKAFIVQKLDGSGAAFVVKIDRGATSLSLCNFKTKRGSNPAWALPLSLCDDGVRSLVFAGRFDTLRHLRPGAKSFEPGVLDARPSSFSCVAVSRQPLCLRRRGSRLKFDNERIGVAVGPIGFARFQRRPFPGMSFIHFPPSRQRGKTSKSHPRSKLGERHDGRNIPISHHPKSNAIQNLRIGRLFIQEPSMKCASIYGKAPCDLRFGAGA